MIVTKETDKQAELGLAVPLDDVPPPYVQRAIPHNSPLPPIPSGSSSSPPAADFLVDPQHQLPDIPASNYVYISKRDASIRQSFAIDTSLDVPQDLSSFPPPTPAKSNKKDDPFAVDEDAPRPHLKLEVQDGSINSDIWLVGGEHEDPARPRTREKAILDVGAKDGSVNIKLHSLTEQPFSLRVWCKDGSITLYVPSTFVGPVNIYTSDGSVVPSDGVSKRLTTFAQFDNTRKCFLGDFRSAGYTDAASWGGSSLDILTKDGSVRLYFLEEFNVKKPKGGLMGKLMGVLERYT